MPPAPNGWRASSGYQYAADPPPPPTPTMYIYPQPLWVHAPLGIYNINVPPPPPAQVEVRVEYTPKSVKANEAPLKEIKLPPPPPKSEKKENSKSEKKEASKKKTNLCKPPSMPPGANYMFPSEHTRVHIFHKAAKVWDGKYKGVKLNFKIFTVSTSNTVESMIEHVRKASKPDGVDFAEHCKGWAGTEVIEGGDSTWYKGSTIEYTSDKAKGTLKDMGWDKKRGKELPPVWICVHKV